MIDEPNIPDQEAGIYTKQLAKDILTEILPYLGIYPTEEITDEERSSLGIQVEKEITAETEVRYVYDEWGNLQYDTTTWEPLTEIVEIEPEEEEPNRENVYGQVAPPEQSAEVGVDENFLDGVTGEELQLE